ncbi:hypothetical protein V6N13_131845 [Hibiscus sabdariffa]|uniref:FLZ-type domain-containing protein n=1 Tax=Hibiscus sabdariffa TaxID=183260 RepID=A0ABR2D9Z5_9ROSI
MKRSRSTSLVNIRVLKPPSSTGFAFQRNSRVNPSVISVHAPPNAHETAKVGILAVSTPKLTIWQENHFLDECFLCKKWLHQNDTRFMYGDFRAFCSLECRGELMSADDEKEKAKMKDPFEVSTWYLT